MRRILTFVKTQTEQSIQVELIRLFYAMVFFSSFGSAAAAIIAYIALRKDEIAAAMDLWIAAILLCKLCEMLDAWISRPKLTADSPVGRIMAKLMPLHGIDAAIWTALVWIVLDTATMIEAITTIAIITGITGGAVSLMSCLFPVMLTYFCVELAVIVPKFLLLPDPSYHTIGYLVVPYLFAMTLMGGNANWTSRKSVILRFENQVLNENLRLEAEKAKLAHQEALQANVTKSRFLAAASHDLRQPIHAAGLFLEALHMIPLTRKQRPIVENAKTSLAGAAQMLDGLLDFSRIEAEVDLTAPRHFPLQHIFAELETEMGVWADEKQIVYRSRDTDVIVYSDPAKVSLILRNLISNAIRYTNKGGVLVLARRRADHVQVEVHDTGVGIAPEFQKDIFQEFFQINNAERNRNQGFGLGLSIAARLCKSLGTSVSVRSILGQGSTFCFQLPFGQAELVTAVQPDAQIKMPLQAAQIKDYILLLDDDDDVRRGMSALFDTWGLAYRAVSTVAEAQKLVTQIAPSLIISDLRLAGDINGIAAVAQLPKALGRDVPAILITGDTGAERLHEVAQSGVPVLHKPVQPQKLAQKIAAALEDIQPQAS